MGWEAFHDPDICWPVVRRAAAAELVDLLHLLGVLLTRPHPGGVLNTFFASDTARRNATWRLRRQGVLATASRRAGPPRLELTAEGRQRVSKSLQPARWWNRPWNGTWYVLVYDVPERQRGYRHALREYLKRLRMGCLQGSVWVSPRDVRPAFDDLVKAANADTYAYLFEARTVLGRRSGDVVFDAWPMEELVAAQGGFCERCATNRDLLSSRAVDSDELGRLAVEELRAFVTIMNADPLLPRALWPTCYQGEEMLTEHRNWTRAVRGQLRRLGAAPFS